ncbi:MAG: helix-turn-helix transcriptional regulator [Firmicutes bacterium]|nr:helix-turn-helix transcriptional regulator [Bacillota bacterium]
MNRRLIILMRALNITGKELADAIHIDTSLVSKWKTGARHLSASSIHLQNMVEYFIYKDQGSGDNIIRDIVLQYDPEADLTDKNAVHTYLNKWLTDPQYSIFPTAEVASTLSEQEAGFYSTGLKVYKGNKGRQIAVLTFLDYVLTLPKGQRLLLISQEDLSWLLEDKEFLHAWQTKLIQVLRKQHQIRIIHWVDRAAGNLASILYEWLPLHLSGGIEAFYSPVYVQPMMSSTLFVVEQAVAVIGMTADDPSRNRYTALVMDPFSIKQAEWAFNHLLEKCRPLVDVHSKMDFNKIIEENLVTGRCNQITYLDTNAPLFTSMSRELLFSVLESNDVDEHATKKCIECYDHFTDNNHSSVKQIVSLAALKKAVLEEKVYNHELSVITGYDIFISKKQFMNHLQDIITAYTNHLDWEIAIEEEKTQPQGQVPINTWISYPTTVVAWSPELPLIASTKESTLLHAYIQYFETKWNLIPRINRDKQWVFKQLATLISS